MAKKAKSRRPGLLRTLLAVLVVLALAATLLFTVFRRQVDTMEYPCRYNEYVEYYAGKYNIDPLILYSFIRTESNFNPNAQSNVGARGLMQIMPSVARQFDVPAAEITDPRTNIWLANKLMSKIMSSLRFPEGTPEKDRMSIILASYNSGIGHVNDARRLARLNGENPNSWEVVARYLTLKAEPEFYENEVVRCGRFTGSRQTLAYVNDVIGRYDRYCRIAGR